MFRIFFSVNSLASKNIFVHTYVTAPPLQISNGLFLNGVLPLLSDCVDGGGGVGGFLSLSLALSFSVMPWTFDLSV